MASCRHTWTSHRTGMEIRCGVGGNLWFENAWSARFTRRCSALGGNRTRGRIAASGGRSMTTLSRSGFMASVASALARDKEWLRRLIKLPWQSTKPNNGQCPVCGTQHPLYSTRHLENYQPGVIATEDPPSTRMIRCTWCNAAFYQETEISK
jgi:hypothetical protein